MGVPIHSEETIARVRAHWNAGTSTKKIADAMGGRWTKNMVVAIARNHGFHPRQSPIKTIGPRTIPVPRAPKQTLPSLPSAATSILIDTLPPLQPAPPPRAATPLPIQNPSRCCWPLNDGDHHRWLFCDAADVVLGKPYCAEHCKIAYVATERISVPRQREEETTALLLEFAPRRVTSPQQGGRFHATP